ncbi:putative hydrolase [Bacillus atrophaeus 1942]|uniref:Hydrolase n=3 Tax=Bacillus atrophaeus TaxID=1452 RepID=A0ABM5LYV6_BACA1|nr:putative hydrolase [Bacillus atrophaeus 1942]
MKIASFKGFFDHLSYYLRYNAVVLERSGHMKKWLTAIGAAVGIIAAIGICFTNIIMFMKKKTDEEIIKRETEDGHDVFEAFDRMEKTAFVIPSSYGYDLKGYYIAPHDTQNTMIICHGVTMNLFNSLKYMHLFLDLGWNVLVYDHRRHGQSGGKTTSYGYYEKDDLKEVVSWLRERVGQRGLVGIHGESMGAVTALLYAGAHPDDGADFYIADCPFASFDEQLAYRLKMEYRLPARPILPLANLFLRWRDGYRTRDVSPLSVIGRIPQPVLFIHSKDDDYIPVEASELLYEKKNGPKSLYIAEAGEHAMSYTKNRESYRNAVKTFLDRVAKP